MTPARRVAPIFALLLLAGSAWGRAGARADDPSPHPASTPSPLAGPKVDPASEGTSGESNATSLIERDFEGRLKRPEANPAVVALELIGLDNETRAKADAIIAERDALLDEVVQNHLKDLVQVAAAAQSGDKAGALRLLKPLIDDSAELRARGRLVDELAGVLPSEKADSLKRLVREYWDAVVKERVALGDPDRPGKKVTVLEAAGAEMLAATGQEIKRSYERVFGLEAKAYEELLKKLSLTPEQESKVRALVSEHFGKTYGKPSKKESTALFVKVYALLDADQRKVLIEDVRKREGYRPPLRPGQGVRSPSETAKPAPGKDEVPVPPMGGE